MTNDTADFAIKLAMMPLELVMSLFGGGGPSVGASTAQTQRVGTSTMGAAPAAQQQAQQAVATVTHTSRAPVSHPPSQTQQVMTTFRPTVQAPRPGRGGRGRFQ